MSPQRHRGLVTMLGAFAIGLFAYTSLGGVEAAIVGALVGAWIGYTA